MYTPAEFDEGAILHCSIEPLRRSGGRIRGGFQNGIARQALGIRGPWCSFPVLPARGGGDGVEGGGVGGGDHRPARGPALPARPTAAADHRGRRDAAFLRPRGRAVAGMWSENPGKVWEKGGTAEGGGRGKTTVSPLFPLAVASLRRCCTCVARGFF